MSASDNQLEIIRRAKSGEESAKETLFNSNLLNDFSYSSDIFVTLNTKFSRIYKNPM